MVRVIWVMVLAGWVLVASTAAPGQGPASAPDQAPAKKRPAGALDRFSVRPIVECRTVRAGESFHVALEMRIAGGFWLYGPVPGGKTVQVQALTIEPGASPLRAGAVRFGPPIPHPTEILSQSETFYVFEGRSYAFVPVRAPTDLKAGEYELPLVIQGQVCDPDVCLQLKTTVTARVQVGEARSPSPDWTNEIQDRLAEARPSETWLAAPATATAPASSAGQWGRAPGRDLPVAAALWLAFIAGLTLNIMPCVLPVVPLKILSLSQQARQSRRRFVTLGLAFVAGIGLFFAALAVLSAVLKLSFAYTLNWGDLFRQPAFIYGMALLLVALAANLFGLFAVTVPGSLAGARTGEGHAGAVGMGFLTAVLSTPCSFAFLTSAFGWAQAQPIWLGTAGILTIGAGMSCPYLVLTAAPKLMARLPRAGRWTELFERFVGFVLLLVAVWLLSTQMDNRLYPAWVAAYGVVLAMCLWVWGSWVRYDAPAGRKAAVRLTAAAVAVAAGWWMLTPPRPLAVDFQPFEEARIAQARRAGRIVLIDFTASWCWTCKTVEKLVYDDQQVARALRTADVLAVKGDITRRGMPAEKMLYDQLGEPGVPVTVIFPPGDKPPIRLYGIFAREELLRHIEAIRKGT